MRSLMGHSDVPSAPSVNGLLPLADGGMSATVALPFVVRSCLEHPRDQRYRFDFSEENINVIPFL